MAMCPLTVLAEEIDQTGIGIADTKEENVG